MSKRILQIGSLLCVSFLAQAQESRLIDELVVSGSANRDEAIATLPFPVTTLSTSDLLNNLPGASANQNGTLTGIAQYRGLFGDRVSVKLDGMPVTGGGPNSMDAPLSYATPLMTESVSLERGIVSVRHAEAMGGHVAAQTERGDFASSDAYQWDGRLVARMGESGNSASSGGRLSLANQMNRFSLTAEVGQGDDYQTGGGTLAPSQFNRDRIDLGYGLQLDDLLLEIYAGRLNTTDSGTPALPMDIASIDTDMYGASLTVDLSDWQLETRLSVNDVDHWMDNFRLRLVPTSAMQYRQTHATGQSDSAELIASTRIEQFDLRLGLNQNRASHDALISNPNMAMFGVQNFNNAQRQAQGGFVEIESTGERLAWSLGVRADRVKSDADSVGATGLTGMMAMQAANLASAFNAAQRELDFDTTDYVASLRFEALSSLDLIAEVGSRSRAPSYQELYLWMPMQSTGGLADGRTYIGNLDLQAETNREILLGAEWQIGSFSVSPRLYQRKVDDYIQGIPSQNMTANMMSTMMSGTPALQFANLDADIVGLDLRWSLQLQPATRLSGSLSHSRGELRDGSDNLYRQAPDRLIAELSHQVGQFGLGIELELAAAQNEVSSYNSETTSAGYGLLHVGFSWQPQNQLMLTARLDNLLDKRYQPHLAGVNRAGGSDIAVGDRIYGTSRAFWMGLDYRF